MTARIRPALVAGSVGIVVILAAILTIQLASREEPVGHAQGSFVTQASTSIATASTVAASPTFDATPTIVVAVDAATVEQTVFDYLEMTGAIRSGEPSVLVSAPVYQQHLIDLGLAVIPYAPTCQREMYLVIVHGDFNISGLAPGFSAQPPMPYIGFVYDVEAANFSQIMPAENGDIFRLALNDPSLPTPLPGAADPPAEGDGWLPCETQPAAEGPTPVIETTAAP